MASSAKLNDLHLSIQCVENADGCPGVIIYGDETFPITSSQQGQGVKERTPTGDAQGSYSSVHLCNFSNLHLTRRGQCYTPGSFSSEEEGAADD